MKIKMKKFSSEKDVPRGLKPTLQTGNDDASSCRQRLNGDYFAALAMTRRGYLLTETMIALAVLGTIMICMAMGLKTFGNFNHYQFARQRCISAAQAQLDSIAATGKSISEEENERLWPKVEIKIEQSDGSGQWVGLKLIKVNASTKSFRKEINIDMARYFASKKENQK